MYRLIMAVVLTAAVASSSYAADRTKDRKWMIGIAGGYATVDMNDVNKDYDVIADAGSVTKIDSGWMGALEGLYKVHPRLAVGPRVEYLVTNQGKLRVGGISEKEDLSLMPVLIGGRYALKSMREEGNTFCDRCGLNLGLFVGWGFAWGQLDAGQTIKYSGSDFAGDVMLGWQHRLSSNWVLGIDLGYRYVPVSEMKTSEDLPALGIRKDIPIVNAQGSKLKYDFSGLLATIGLGYRF
jgi:opacity protein-like surface antigen